MAPQQTYRLALAIHGRLQQQRSNIRTIELPESVWLTCQSLQRQLRRAMAHDWQLAARRLDRDFNVQLRTLLDQMRQIVGDRMTTVTKHMPTVRDIYQDILSLEPSSKVSLGAFGKGRCPLRLLTSSWEVLIWGAFRSNSIGANFLIQQPSESSRSIRTQRTATSRLHTRTSTASRSVSGMQGCRFNMH